MIKLNIKNKWEFSSLKTARNFDTEVYLKWLNALNILRIDKSK